MMKKEIKTVFIYPDRTGLGRLRDIKYLPFDIKQGNLKPVIPLGILSVWTNCKSPADFIDNSILKYDNKMLADEVLKLKPDVAAFGGVMLGWKQASEVSAVLREKGIITVYGGPNASSRPEKHVDYFDYVIKGRGEDVFNLLLEELKKANYNMNIAGLSYKGYISDKKAAFNPDAAVSADRSLLNIDDYDRTAEYEEYSPFDMLFSTYGCPYSCKFCAGQYVWQREYLLRDINKIEEEILTLINRFKSRSILFCDENFTVHKDRLEKICHIMKNLDIPWRCKGRLDNLDRNTVKLLKESGCYALRCGFESVNDDTLEYVNKGFGFDDIVRATEIFDEYGMLWRGGLLVGFPNEKEKHISNTTRFIKKMNEKNCFGFGTAPFRFLGIPVSELYNTILEKELVYYDWSGGELLVPNTFYLGSEDVEKIIELNL